MFSSQANAHSASDMELGMGQERSNATSHVFSQAGSLEDGVRNTGSSSSTRQGAPDPGQSSSADYTAFDFPSVYEQGEGLLRMSVQQGEDSSYRLVQDCSNAASAVMWDMEKRTQGLYQKFAWQYVQGNEEWKETLSGGLRNAVREQCDFIMAYNAVESLGEPSQGSFDRFRLYWTGLKADGFNPSEHKYKWKRLYALPGHEHVAREILERSPKWVQKILAKYATVHSDPCRVLYDEKIMTTTVTVAIILFAVPLFSVPMVLLALEVISSKGVRVAVIVASNTILGVALMVFGMGPGYALGVTLAYSAVLVNVDV